MPVQRTEALVLKKRDFRETSIIATFFTRDYGKVTGVLKGIRKEPAKFASTLEPFSHNEIFFYPSRTSSLHLVSQCELKNDFTPLRRDISRVCAGSMVVELIDAVMPPEDRNEEVFSLALDCLNILAHDPANTEKVTTIFKIKILALSGFKPNFQTCVACGTRISGDSRFSLALGGLICGRCFPKDLRSRAIFRGTIASILHIQKNDLRTNLNLGMNPEIKKELGIVLSSFLNFHLEKELKTQRLMNKLELAAGRI